MTYKLRNILFLLLALAFVSCGNKNDVRQLKPLNQDQVNEKLVEANRAAIEFENNQIDKTIDSLGWNMLKTATGLRYQIIEKGNGLNAESGKTARFTYEIKLLNSTLIYSSDKSGPKEFRIGSGGVESGLEEGILLLRVGDKARFVIPSYLAHGLSGDQDKIPPKATLIYTLKIIEIK